MPFDVTVEEPQEEVQPQNQRQQSQPQSQPRSEPSAATPQGQVRATDIQGQLDKIMKDPKHAYWNTRDSGNQAHKDAVAEVTRLNQELAGLKDGADAKPDAKGDLKASTLSEARPSDWETQNGRQNETSFRGLAQDLGLPIEIVNTAVAEIAKAGTGQAYADGDAAEAAARKVFGDEGFETAQVHANVAVTAGGPELRQFLLTTNLANNVAVFKYLAKVGAEMVEAKKGISAMQADPRYQNAQHPEHGLSVKEMQRLQKILAPFERDLR